MLTTVLWWAGPVLEIALIVRAVQKGLFLRYPIFFSYLAWVALVDCLRNLVYFYDRPSYDPVYWSTQFLSLIIGYGVILEILRLTLTRYPGAARLARFLVVFIFAAIFAYVGFQALTSPYWSPGSTHSALERDLRGAQVAVLAGILGVIGYFRIPLGKNLKGLISGFGLFLASSVITLATWSYQLTGFSKIWFVVQPLIFLVCLLIWTFTMWSYHPNPRAQFEGELEGYLEYAASARAALSAVRTNLGKVARP
ncbi:MAG TPA: hypothetical protein VMJ93_13165 [Verrucomicrobiae bacterium]|nr:hypothetical protein [Verrucomicrobiae bacterium]